MRPKRAASDYLRDILDEMEKPERFVAGLDLSQFAANEEKVYAVVRAIEIIGEASRSLSKPVRNKYVSVPWRDMSGMRDKLIHDYPGVNVAVVWQTVKEDIPRLKPLIARMLAELSKQDRATDEK